jgi:uncharacterized membrane protein YfcA
MMDIITNFRLYFKGRISVNNVFVTFVFGTAAVAAFAGSNGGIGTGDNQFGGLPPVVFLAPIFFGVSFFYSSVGFGGGSSYIAILVLAGTSLVAVPPIALILNISAASMAMTNFARAKYLSIKFAVPFLSSVPFAFVAGLIVLPQQNLAWIFASALFAASAALFITSKAKKVGIEERSVVIEAANSFLPQKIAKAIKKIKIVTSKGDQKHARGMVDAKCTNNREYEHTKSLPRLFLIGFPIGAVLGTVAGLVGIGGGIWLSPILILSGLAKPKRAAATASLFILANSISGLAAYSISKPVDTTLLLPLVVTVFVGGFIGSRLGAFKFDHNKIKIIVACLVFVAGLIIVLKTIL